MQERRLAKATIRDFRSNLRMLEREVVTQLEGETTCCGVTLAQCHTLLELSQREHSLTALADVLDLDKSTLSRTVETMVQLGLCERTTVAGDRRSVRLTISDLGLSKVDTINRTCDAYYGKVLGQLSDTDRQQVIRSVGILAESMRRLRVEGKALPSCCSDNSEKKVVTDSVEGRAAQTNKTKKSTPRKKRLPG